MEENTDVEEGIKNKQEKEKREQRKKLRMNEKVIKRKKTKKSE